MPAKVISDNTVACMQHGNFLPLSKFGAIYLWLQCIHSYGMCFTFKYGCKATCIAPAAGVYSADKVFFITPKDKIIKSCFYIKKNLHFGYKTVMQIFIYLMLFTKDYSCMTPACCHDPCLLSQLSVEMHNILVRCSIWYLSYISLFWEDSHHHSL